jgi:hypothetical protein
MAIFTRAGYSEPAESSSSPTSSSFRSILIFSISAIAFMPVSDLLPSGFPIKVFYEFLTYLMCATCPAHLIVLDLTFLIIGLFDESYEVRRWASSSIFQSAFTSLLLGSNIICVIMFSKTCNLCSSFNAGQISRI